MTGVNENYLNVFTQVYTPKVPSVKLLVTILTYQRPEVYEVLYLSVMFSNIWKV